MSEDELSNDENAESVDGEAGNAAEATPPQRKKRFGFFAPLIGLIMALGAGGLGGFAAHEYFDAPPPDLSVLTQDITALEKKLTAQTARVSQLESQSQKGRARLSRDLSKLDADWQAGLTALDAKIAAIDIPPAARPVVKIAPEPEGEPEIEADIEAETETEIQAENVRDANDGAQDIGGGADVPREAGGVAAASIETMIDPRPELLAVVESLRGDVEQDLSAVKARLDRLEAASKDSAPKGSAPTDGGKFAAPAAQAFPMDDILAEIKAASPAEPAQNWWDKVLRKHVSLKRTDHDAAAAVLKDIQAAILIEDWPQAESLSAQLPEPARRSVKEWIARARR